MCYYKQNQHDSKTQSTVDMTLTCLYYCHWLTQWLWFLYCQTDERLTGRGARGKAALQRGSIGQLQVCNERNTNTHPNSTVLQHTIWTPLTRLLLLWIWNTRTNDWNNFQIAAIWMHINRIYNNHKKLPQRNTLYKNEYYIYICLYPYIWCAIKRITDQSDPNPIPYPCAHQTQHKTVHCWDTKLPDRVHKNHTLSLSHTHSALLSGSMD